MWYVYVLYSREDDRFYIGVTNDLRRRIAEHQRGKTHTTARMAELKLVYYEASISKEDALTRERQLKTGFGRGYLRRRIEHFLSGN